jgi:hypothetical protein
MPRNTWNEAHAFIDEKLASNLFQCPIIEVVCDAHDTLVFSLFCFFSQFALFSLVRNTTKRDADVYQ